ncbi:hypothetical protein ACSQ67_009787 [Phaseolus vulgaris]
MQSSIEINFICIFNGYLEPKCKMLQKSFLGFWQSVMKFAENHKVEDEGPSRGDTGRCSAIKAGNGTVAG